MLRKSRKARIFTVLLALLLFAQCAYFDDNLISGTEARQIIVDRIQYNIILYGVLGVWPYVGLFLITPNLIVTDMSKTYSKREVESCADLVFLLGLYGPPVFTPIFCDVSPEPIQIPVFTQEI